MVFTTTHEKALWSPSSATPCAGDGAVSGPIFKSDPKLSAEAAPMPPIRGYGSRFYQERAPLLARTHGITYPADLDRVMVDRLEKLCT